MIEKTSTTFQILLLSVTDSKADPVNKSQVYQAQDCEVCMEKGALAGVIVFVVFVILLTNAASVYLYLRGQGVRKHRVGKMSTGTTGPGDQKQSAM